MQNFLRRCWAEIDLGRLSHNMALIRKKVGKKVKIMGVVKADGYGHGDRMTALAMQRDGVDFFGVSNIEEALTLRRCGIVRPILIFGITPSEHAPTLAKYEIAQALFSPEYAQELSAAAKKAGVDVHVHVKVDTGMSRIGFVCTGGVAETCDAIATACALPGIIPAGIFTHFAVADDPSPESVAFTKGQFALFMEVVGALKERGVRFPLRHCCNSAGLLRYPEMHLDMVRPGIICYGLTPSGAMEFRDFKQVMALRAAVSMVKSIPPHTSVSYGRIYESPDERLIATLPIGYADGYARGLGGKAHALIRGQFAPVVGRVCMDQLMLDVTHIPGVHPGEEATLFGPDGMGNEVDTDAMSRLVDTIGYETICLISKRVPRVYVQNGERVAVVDAYTGQRDE